MRTLRVYAYRNILSNSYSIPTNHQPPTNTVAPVSSDDIIIMYRKYPVNTRKSTKTALKCCWMPLFQHRAFLKNFSKIFPHCSGQRKQNCKDGGITPLCPLCPLHTLSQKCSYTSGVRLIRRTPQGMENESRWQNATGLQQLNY